MQRNKINGRIRLLVLMIALLVFGLSNSLTGQSRQLSATCSGDDCGCGIEMQQCMADCNADPVPTLQICLRGCRQQYKSCAIACCS